MRRSLTKTAVCLLFIISLTSIIVSLSIHPVLNRGEEFRHRRSLLNVKTDTQETTWSPKLESSTSNCTPAAIEQFPRPLMSYNVRRNGGLIIHIIVSLYMFLGLAVVCDEYFVPSLEGMSNFMNLESDVAGATFMAAGSSAPELAAAVIGVFIAKDDIGVGTVVGSAVYNIAFVIGICGLCARRIIYLNWWPLFRDSMFYLISIIALLIVMYNEVITWPESVVLLLLYGAYIAFMFVNKHVEAWIQKLPCPCPAYVSQGENEENENSHLIGYKSLSSTNGTIESSNSPPPSIKEQKVNEPYTAVYDEDENPFDPPKSRSRLALWIISLPLTAVCYITIPDCRKARWRKWYLVTFLMSCVWIAAFSYILVWMITIIGFTLSIPDTVMGLTFLAAGVSVPDAIASLLVIRNGYGDMAVSNAVGSNVFDILLCLGLPWFLQTAIVNPGSHVIVRSKGLTYSTLSLLSTVLFLLVTTYLNNWKLDKKHGIIMMIWYVAFMVMASLYELNVFGYFNPPSCPSDY
ncbi:probable sodium/potassium/calcium exchanger CG1090 isoform X2 [Centruroides vittatus]